MDRLAIVVQRYGQELTGGAELHSRWAVEHLRNDFDITILTTTAASYLTWENHFPAGESSVDGIKLIRYPVQKPRQVELFDQYSEWIFHHEHRDIDEQRWIDMQGPYCPDLLAALEEKSDEFDAFFFFTYLYYTTALGIEIVRDKAILLPTAHDENAIRLRKYKDVFQAPRGFILNTSEEERLIDELFETQSTPREVAGMGVEWPDPMPDPTPTLEKYGLDRPFAVSSGRISVGKGHDYIFDMLPSTDADIDLVLFGKMELEMPDDPRVKFLGFVSEEEKWHLTSAALFSIQPSQYESLSLTLLESLAMGVPVLVNDTCAVLRSHVDKSKAGLAFHYREDFKAMFERLATDAELRQELGQNGKAYVMKNYENSAVAKKYVDFVKRMITNRKAGVINDGY
jgi:glycosyltransferase involved in cell wall biosynthesis